MLEDGVLKDLGRGAPQKIVDVVRALRRANVVEANGYVSHDGVSELQSIAQADMWRQSTPEHVDTTFQETWQYDDLFDDLMRRRALKKVQQHLWMATILRAWLAHTLRMRHGRLFSASITTVRRSRYLWWKHTTSNIKNLMALLLSATFAVRMPRAPVFAFWQRQTRILTAIHLKELSCMRRCWCAWASLLLARKLLYFRIWTVATARSRALRRTIRSMMARQTAACFRFWFVLVRLHQMKLARDVRTRREHLRALRLTVAAERLHRRTITRRQFARWREQARHVRIVRMALTCSLWAWHQAQLSSSIQVWRALVRWKRRIGRSLDKHIWLKVRGVL
jgi:hypothetical protein